MQFGPMLPPSDRLVYEMRCCKVNLVLRVLDLGQREVGHKLMDELGNYAMVALAVILDEVWRITNQGLSICVYKKHLRLGKACPSMLEILVCGACTPHAAIVQTVAKATVGPPCLS